jgi:hypothetical protein
VSPVVAAVEETRGLSNTNYLEDGTPVVGEE